MAANAEQQRRHQAKRRLVLARLREERPKLYARWMADADAQLEASTGGSSDGMG